MANWIEEAEEKFKKQIIEEAEKYLYTAQEGSLLDRIWKGESIFSKPSDDEPYFGWCDVDGCENEGCSGGMAWRDTGYWTVCSKHSQMNREGKKQPKMKQTAIDKEKTRKPDGTLP